MKKKLQTVLVALFCIGFLGTGGAQESGSKPIQISLFAPAQLVDETYSIHGLRLNFIYGKNKDVYGLDIGLCQKNTGTVKGIQYGIVNLVDGDFSGYQDGWFNRVGQNFRGIQTAAVNLNYGILYGAQFAFFNYTKEGKGFQFGLINNSEKFGGLQLGLINAATRLKGIQIGFLNFIWEGEGLPFFPIINGRFEY